MTDKDIATTEETGGALVSADEWQKELAAFAQEATATETPAASNISLRSGQMSYNGNPIPDNKLPCVVLNSIHEHTYYREDYDPDNIKPPTCFALGDGDGMRPHENSAEPQAETCAECPQFKWGSSPKGKGKACQERRRLALIPETTEPDKVLSAEVATIKIPVTSVKNWSGYVNLLAAQYKRPPFAVVTTISTAPDPKSQFKVNFECKDLLGPDMGQALMAKRKMADVVLMTPYDVATEEDEEKPKGKKKY